MEYDVIIIGGGPAGATAAIYCARYQLKTLVLSKDLGRLSTSFEVENFPTIKKATGLEIIQKIHEQAKNFGVKMDFDQVEKIIKTNDNLFEIKTLTKIHRAKGIIIASGLATRLIGIESEKKFTGRGVSYCYTCDAPFAKDKIAAVVGGGDAAIEAALLLSEYATKVFLIHRREEFRAEPIMVERLKKMEKVELVLNATVKELKGEKWLEKAILNQKGSEKELTINNLFVEIGADPKTEMFLELNLKLHEKGFIKVNEKQETNVPGVLAAGDITTNSAGFQQATTAVGEGALAANSVYKYILSKFK